MQATMLQTELTAFVICSSSGSGCWVEVNIDSALSSLRVIGLLCVSMLSVWIFGADALSQHLQCNVAVSILDAACTLPSCACSPFFVLLHAQEPKSAHNSSSAQKITEIRALFYTWHLQYL